MIGRLIDKNNLEAFVEFIDGSTYCITLDKIPTNSKVGDVVNINSSIPTNVQNRKTIDFF